MSEHDWYADGPALSRDIGGLELSRLVSATHLSWNFDAKRTAALEAALALRTIGPLRLAWLRTNEWGGERDTTDIRTNPEPYLTFLMPLGGCIKLRDRERAVEVHKHEIGIWDSSVPLAFNIDSAHYEQLSVLVPQRLLRAGRRACRAVHCARVERTNVLSELCVRHMKTLAKFLDGEIQPYEISLTHVTTSLFDAVIATLQGTSRDRDHLLAAIKEYVECYIADDELSAASIADAFNVSARYVHKLFEPEGISVREWILARRIERSAEDLVQSDDRVTDIAMRWGFKDVAHYSRVFRQRIGVPPSRYREGKTKQ